MKVVALGTSSATPTADRYLSALALVTEGSWFLFDCGEGTQYRLLAAPVRMGHLRAVFITHLHGDHVYGLPGLLATLSMQNREEPLDVFGPPGIATFVSTAIDASHVYLGYELHLGEIADSLLFEAEGTRVHAAPLDHTVPTFGFRLEEAERPGKFDPERAAELGIPAGPAFGALQRGESVMLDDGRVIASSEVVGVRRPGRSFAYCSDTRPCEASVALASDCDLLVHEATYGDDAGAMAYARGHSTARQAAKIARAAGVRRLLLTHFSSRYGDVSELLAQAREEFPATEAACDLVSWEVRYRDE